jgi:hypothetical protein
MNTVLSNLIQKRRLRVSAPDSMPAPLLEAAAWLRAGYLLLLSGPKS